MHRAQQFPSVLPQTLAETLLSRRRDSLAPPTPTSCPQRRSRLATPPRASEGATTTPSPRSLTFRRRLMWPQVGPPMVRNPVPLVHYLGFGTLVCFMAEVACGGWKDTDSPWVGTLCRDAQFAHGHRVTAAVSTVVGLAWQRRA